LEGRRHAAWALPKWVVGHVAALPPSYSLLFHVDRAVPVDPAMRLIIGIACLLAGLGILLCRVDTDAAPQAAERNGPTWVRTVDGWERVDSWYVDGVSPPRLHPLVVAAGQGLVSLLGLAAAKRER
jgi:hypothetical protein